jgi:hypothetical protein
MRSPLISTTGFVIESPSSVSINAPATRKETSSAANTGAVSTNRVNDTIGLGFVLGIW